MIGGVPVKQIFYGVMLSVYFKGLFAVELSEKEFGYFFTVRRIDRIYQPFENLPAADDFFFYAVGLFIRITANIVIDNIEVVYAVEPVKQPRRSLFKMSEYSVLIKINKRKLAFNDFTAEFVFFDFVKDKREYLLRVPFVV